MSSLLREDGGYDRGAIMALSHERYRAPGNGWTYQDCLRWAWKSAQHERRLFAARRLDDLRRVRDMRAHHLARLRAPIAARAA